MLEFEITQTLKPNNEILGAIKEFTYKVKKGAVKHLLHTNLQVIEPTTYPATLTIFECKVNEISNKPFYIKEYNQKYNLKEIMKILKKFKV